MCINKIVPMWNLRLPRYWIDAALKINGPLIHLLVFTDSLCLTFKVDAQSFHDERRRHTSVLPLLLIICPLDTQHGFHVL